MRRRSATGITLAFGLLLSITAAADAPAPIATTVCQLADAGKRMHGQKVRLKAVLISDLMHSSVLKDRDCPTRNVTPFSDKPDGDTSIEAFDDAIRGSLDDYELRVFAVDVSGIFRWSEEGQPHGELVLEKVWSYKRHHGDWRDLEIP